MLFDYPKFLEELWDLNPESVRKYEETVQDLGLRPIENIFLEGAEIYGTGEQWYRTLVRPFPKYEGFQVPIELRLDFDWGLFSQLAASSISSEIDFIQVNNELRMLIRTETKDTSVTKDLKMLWGFQIRRLFEIWIEENINLCHLYFEDESEREGIIQAKKSRLSNWKYKLHKAKLYLRNVA